MFSEYIAASLDQAQYDTLEDGTYVATVEGLRGVWAVGKTIEECRKELISVIEGWIVVRLRLGLPIPPMGGHEIISSAEPVSIVE